MLNGVRLRRELNVWQAIGFSLAFMTPSAAININPQAIAGAVDALCRWPWLWWRSELDEWQQHQAKDSGSA